VPGLQREQLVALPPAEKVPGPHAAQVVPLTKLPAGHSTGVQAKSPGGATVPQGHAVQFRSPVALANVFGAHGSQLSAPKPYATLPWLHGMHELLCPNVPGAHATHCELLAAAV
jgi:hypothetical protein